MQAQTEASRYKHSRNGSAKDLENITSHLRSLDLTSQTLGVKTMESQLCLVVEEGDAVLEAVEVLVVLASLVDDSEAGEGSGEVFPLAVLFAGLATTQVGQPGDGVENEVDESDNDDDAEGVGVDTNDGNDVSPATVGGNAVGLGAGRGAGQPTEEGEHGGEDIHTKNGGGELEGWPGAVATGNEDEPVLGEGDLEEENALD